jgi:hypothetical protein
MLCLLALLVSFVLIGNLWAQDAYVEDEYEPDSTYQKDYDMTDEINTGGYLPNKYLVISVCLMAIAIFYYLFLSLYEKELDRGKSPLKAAAGQCLKFTLVSGLVILCGMFALNGLSFRNIGDFIASSLAYLMIIGLVWVAYLVASIVKVS